jgi:hypothetical protein
VLREATRIQQRDNTMERHMSSDNQPGYATDSPANPAIPLEYQNHPTFSQTTATGRHPMPPVISWSSEGGGMPVGQHQAFSAPAGNDEVMAPYRYGSQTFPHILHVMLSEAEGCEDLAPTVRWLPHGRAFKCFDQNRFVEKILPT